MTSTYPTRVEVTDVGPRDGLQSEKTFIPTAKKVELINRLIDAGVPRLEVTSFVSPKAVPQLAAAAEVMAGVEIPTLCDHPNLTPTPPRR